jgi:alkanesulfonate monooxygenase SsuD/methylene tetrahydromethanopterin reductase-like flavin-dependent oxidoreductase (luciferase family)
LVKLPIRQPVLVAKQAASVAVLTGKLTGNRFGFGVGLSPWPEDFFVTGSDWKSRGKRMDEMIEIIRGLTARADSGRPAQRGEAERSSHETATGGLLRVPRRPLRPREHPDLPGPDAADSDPDRRSRRAGAAPRCAPG